ncbi:glycoside hydrolase family 68 protein [Novosphingobium lentum]|uniref:glycoside hydrolase family 68 protein n=1 Tax=Novosphingobium lentum TaxID=145287 RepID=UPI0009FF3D94|nr:glycoside hydrolase family 68 protein [Novosphingobium lentum]
MKPDLPSAPGAASLPTFDPAAVTRWEPVAFDRVPEIAPIAAIDSTPILPGLDLWDCWPLQHEDGRTVTHRDRQWWFFLSAPCFPDPVQRHDAARIRLVSRGADGWRDHGNAMPDGHSPGSREWAGSAVLLDDGITVLLLFTAAGRRDEAPSFEQRLFACQGTLGADGPSGWQAPREMFVADGSRYVLDRQDSGRVGEIKGFRDPAWFRDPATGLRHILFTGSAAWSGDPHNGVIGSATQANDGTWTLGDPLVEAIGVNNELERPHILQRDGRYYLFWSTQRHTYGPAAVAGPNGLYAMVANGLDGPWRPVNGNALVAANPADEPTQGYSWWVTGEGAVWSFVDHWGMQGRSLADHPELLRSHFGGTPAPVFHLEFDGDSILLR